MEVIQQTQLYTRELRSDIQQTSSSLLASAQTMIFYMVYNGISSQRTCKKILEVVYKVGSLRSCYSRVNQLG